MRLAMIVEYEGTQYHGFQYQVNASSIQEELEKAIASLTGEKVRINGAGRTDAGVHAKGQVVAFDTKSEHSAETFLRAMNHYLPDDIAVKAVYTVAEGFDPRRNALSRTYRYTILNSSVPSPLLRRTSCRIIGSLDLERMQEAAKLYLGKHDFRLMAAPLEKAEASTIREVYRVGLERKDELLRFNVTGSAFLPHQVRRMAGALVDVGRNKLSQVELRKIVDGGETEAIAHSLPAKGLCLMSVQYEDFPPEVVLERTQN